MKKKALSIVLLLSVVQMHASNSESINSGGIGPSECFQEKDEENVAVLNEELREVEAEKKDLQIKAAITIQNAVRAYNDKKRVVGSEAGDTKHKLATGDGSPKLFSRDQSLVRRERDYDLLSSKKIVAKDGGKLPSRANHGGARNCCSKVYTGILWLVWGDSVNATQEKKKQ